MRHLLEGWSQRAALTSERSRVRMQLPTDLDAVQQAADQRDAETLTRLQPQRWPQGLRVPGFDGFWAWSQQQQQRLLRQWHGAVEQTVIALLQQGDGVAALCLFAARREADPPAAAWLLALDAHSLSPAARRPGGPAAMQPGLVPSAPVVAAAVAAGFAGCAVELATLRRSEVAAIVVLGEAGIGKTTLLRAAQPQALHLRGREGLDAVPYGPVVELLHAQPALQTHAGAYRFDLARVLPESWSSSRTAAACAGSRALARAGLARRAALTLAQHFGAAAAPLKVATHWDQAAQPQTALAWCHRGARS